MSENDESPESIPGTSIWIPLWLKTILEESKLHPREPYYSVISRLITTGEVNGGIRKK
jgi:hypothetical protein